MKKILIILLIIFSGVSVKAVGNYYADSYILMEASSKRVLEGKNINNQYLTASICKIMTAIVTIENSDIDGYVTVTKEDVFQIGSKIYLEENDVVKVRDLLYGLMLRSGNDCAYMLAKYVGGTVDNFVELMNKYCKIIGMKNSLFFNPSGLDDETENYSTAYDMAILMVYCMKNKIYREINNTNKYNFSTLNGKKYYLSNKHKLITGYSFIIGGKTGYTKKAKRTLVSYAEKNNMELVCVTFNCSDDWNTHMSLFNYGFNQYEMKTILKRQIIKTDKDYLYMPYLNNNIKIPLKEKEKYTIKVYLLNNVSDDMKVIGKVIIYIDNKEIVEELLYRYYL